MTLLREGLDIPDSETDQAGWNAKYVVATSRERYMVLLL
jgi:hypothetical protein